MFEQERISNVVVKIRKCGKQQNFSVDVQINESSEVDLCVLSAILKSLKAVQQNDMIFYFNHSVGHYVKINQQNPFIPTNNLIKENLICIQIETILSDEVLANPMVQQSYERRSKRNPQKTISQAFLLVYQWRQLYLEGVLDQKGQITKINLDQAAEIVGSPKKTLEDYYLLFRKGVKGMFKFKQYRGGKIGLLRSFVKQVQSKGKNSFRENKVTFINQGQQQKKGEMSNKDKNAQKQITQKNKQQNREKFDQRKFFKLLLPELTSCLDMEIQNQIFNVLDQGSSDQDLLFQN